jgi:hypothetical protein
VTSIAYSFITVADISLIMDENARLQARIAALSGQIKQHKERPASLAHYGHHNSTAYAVSHSYREPRWSPYGRGGRGGRAGYANTHKNRTLVLNGSPGVASEVSSSDGHAGVSDLRTGTQGTNYVSTRSAGKNQLMAKNIYDRELKQKHGQLEENEAIRKAALDAAVPVSHSEPTSAQHRHELMISGIRFRMADDGSKLFRVSGEPSLPFKTEMMLNSFVLDGTQETPKTAKVADVLFIRTKRGNLIRASASKSNTRYRHMQLRGDHAQRIILTNNRIATAPRKAQCEHFTKFGTDHHTHARPVLIAAKITTIRTDYCEPVSSNAFY